jgi:hypothetical protein
MFRVLEQHIAAIWNRLKGRERGAWSEGAGVNLGFRVVDGQVTRAPVTLSSKRRAMHLAEVGVTGVGKSSLMKTQCAQDIEADYGFLAYDLHNELTPFLLKVINARERRLRRHLSDKLIIISPDDPELSVGLNPIAAPADFVKVIRVMRVLKRHCGLDQFGVRIEEVLRNSIYVLSENNLTLLELTLLLTDTAFRAACLKNVSNAEVRQYFELRYDRLSEAMQAAIREPAINKLQELNADPHFRHIIGQQHSTFSISEALDEGHWVIVNLNKGRLGEQALTLGGLIFTMLKDAIFARKTRSPFTIYIDEVQNFVDQADDLETMLSEARKFGVGIVSANQFLNQYPPDMRAAILSVGTHVFFRLSSLDAAQIAQALDGGKPLVERLKNLPDRHAIVKSSSDRMTEILVPTVTEPQVDFTDLLNRSRYTYGRVRAHIERDIAERQKALRHNAENDLK